MAQQAKALNLPHSEGKGHSVAQGGPFTGVNIDTFLGRYLMLSEMLAFIRFTFAALVNAESSTPHLLVQARARRHTTAAPYNCLRSFAPRSRRRLFTKRRQSTVSERQT